jgi:hypothetical protein
MKLDIFKIKSIPRIENFKNKVSIKTKRTSKFIDARKTYYNHIVCEDTGEIIKSYSAYLKSKHWRLFKKSFRNSKYCKSKCFICSKEKGIQLHHLTYERIGKEVFTDVIELCKSCHRNVHKALDKGKTWESIVKQIKDILNS